MTPSHAQLLSHMKEKPSPGLARRGRSTRYHAHKSATGFPPGFRFRNENRRMATAGEQSSRTFASVLHTPRSIHHASQRRASAQGERLHWLAQVVPLPHPPLLRRQGERGCAAAASCAAAARSAGAQPVGRASAAAADRCWCVL